MSGKNRDTLRTRRQSYRSNLSTRYPNGRPVGIPAEVYNQAAATDATNLAREVVDRF